MSDKKPPLPPHVEALAAFEDPHRRDLYRHVASAAEPVTRDEAAQATGLSRALAAFHLDRLVASGLLAAGFERRSGRTGPGAGRPSKVYRRADTQFDVSLPPRRYELAAQVLAEALAATKDPATLEALHAAARVRGEVLAHA